MTSRSLSVGDVVQLENQFFLCSAASFIPVAFEPVAETAKAPADTLIMPNGTVLQVKICSEDEYPCSTDEDTVYYGSYNQGNNHAESL